MGSLGYFFSSSTPHTFVCGVLERWRAPFFTSGQVTVIQALRSS